MTFSLFGGSLSTATTQAHTFPQQPIKVIVPFGAGGGSDTFARIIQKAVQDDNLLPHPLVIINVPGAGGTIGSRQARDAAPDGYTIMCLHEAILTARKAGKVDYGPESFEAVAGTGRTGLVYAVHESSRFKSLDDLMTEAREKPGTISVGVNVGAPSHFVALRLEQSVPDVQFRYVNQGGGAERFGNLRGRHIDMSVFSLAEYQQFKPAGMRALAYCGDMRHTEAADVPTAIEQGYPVNSSNIQFWWAPKGTPADRVAIIGDALAKAMREPAVVQRLADLHTDPIVLQGDALQDEVALRNDAVAKVQVRLPEELPNLPLIVAAVTALLATLALAQGLITRSRNVAVSCESDSNESAEAGTQWFSAIAIPAITIVYAAVLTWRVADFRITTTVFIVATGIAFAEHRAKAFVWVAPLALVFSLGLHYLFTAVLVIDLP